MIIHKIMYLSTAFPHLFPFGLSKDSFGTATIPQVVRQTWLKFYDQRCAEDLDLIFLLFDQQQRHATNAAVAYKIKSGGKREQEFIDIVNDPEFLYTLKTATVDPKSNECKNIKKRIAPLIKTHWSYFPWTVFVEHCDIFNALVDQQHLLLYHLASK